MRLRVLSYNIHKGFSQFGDMVLPKIKASIWEVGADLVFLQEIIGYHSLHSVNHPEWPTTSPIEYLAGEIWPHHAYGKNAIYEDGHHGNALLSRRPLSSAENIDVSNNRLERRGLLHAIVPADDGGQPVHAICVHLDLFESGRRRQVDRLARRIEASVPQDCPLIIAGDFNDWRERAGSRLERVLGVEDCYKRLHGQNAKTFPSWYPFLRLDRIYVRGLVPIAAGALSGAPWSELSDHNALYADLET
jgi:endonuclease/exonuclease/phosphatase family metal-dependent hydrolase